MRPAALLSAAILAAILAAATLSAQAPPATTPADPPAVKKAIDAMQAGWPHWNPAEKVDAADKLAALGGPEAAQTLAGKLEDPAPLVRRALAADLGKLKDPKTVPALAAALDREQGEKTDVETFKAVAKALGDIGDPKAVEPLAHNLFSGDRQKIEWQDQADARVEALGSIRHKEAVDELISLLGRSGTTGRRNASSGAANHKLAVAIERSLRRLTGQTLRDENAWRAWWKDNREKFRFP